MEGREGLELCFVEKMVLGSQHRDGTISQLETRDAINLDFTIPLWLEVGLQWGAGLLGVSVSWGSLVCVCPNNKSFTIFGSILGPLIFGNSLLGSSYGAKTFRKRLHIEAQT